MTTPTLNTPEEQVLYLTDRIKRAVIAAGGPEPQSEEYADYEVDSYVAKLQINGKRFAVLPWPSDITLRFENAGAAGENVEPGDDFEQMVFCYYKVEGPDFPLARFVCRLLDGTNVFNLEEITLPDGRTGLEIAELIKGI